MITVNFYDTVDEDLLKFAVIISKSQGKWILCKHRDRTTYECPGGHREVGEDILTTAKRELYEETGAVDYSLKQICVYSVTTYDNNQPANETFGMLYYADILKFKTLPVSEIEKIEQFDTLPENWTYPMIQPKLIKKVIDVLSIS